MTREIETTDIVLMREYVKNRLEATEATEGDRVSLGINVAEVINVADVCAFVQDASDSDCKSIASALSDGFWMDNLLPDADMYGLIETGSAIHICIPARLMGEVLAARECREVINQIGLEKAAQILKGGRYA